MKCGSGVATGEPVETEPSGDDPIELGQPEDEQRPEQEQGMGMEEGVCGGTISLGSSANTMFARL